MLFAGSFFVSVAAGKWTSSFSGQSFDVHATPPTSTFHLNHKIPVLYARQVRSEYASCSMDGKQRSQQIKLSTIKTCRYPGDPPRGQSALDGSSFMTERECSCMLWACISWCLETLASCWIVASSINMITTVLEPLRLLSKVIGWGLVFQELLPDYILYNRKQLYEWTDLRIQQLLSKWRVQPFPAKKDHESLRWNGLKQEMTTFCYI